MSLRHIKVSKYFLELDTNWSVLVGSRNELEHDTFTIKLK